MIRLPGPAASPAAQEPSPVADSLPSPDEMSDALREILAGPEFVSPPLPARQRIFEWIARTLSDAWEWLRRFLFDEGGGLMEMLAILVVLAALIALGAVALRVPQWVHRVREKEDEGPEDIGAPASAREWFGLARTCAGEEEFRPAASALYQGFLLTLDGKGTVAFHPSKTPGDYALEMETGAGRNFLRHFQGLSFGQETPTRAGYAVLENLARDSGCPMPASSGEPGPS